MASKKSDEYKSVFGNRGNGGTGSSKRANWGLAEPATIFELIKKASSRGGAVRFGYTRDGGAYALGLYYGSEHVTKYCPPDQNVNKFLSEWYDFFEQFPDTGGVSPG